MSKWIEEYILQFPKAWEFRLGDSVDAAVKEFAVRNRDTLGAIKSSVISVIGAIRGTLEGIPWIVLVLAVVALAWYLTRRWRVGVAYGLMLVFVGCSGLWGHMLQTLSVVIASVVLCALGFPSVHSP